LPDKQALIKKSKPKKKLAKPPLKKEPNWVAVGFDVSVSSIAGAAFGWDGTLRRSVGPVTVAKRWTRDNDYPERLEDSVRSYVFVLDLIAKLKMTPELDEVFIAIEEPWPFGMQKRLESNSLKQQAQISGAFFGGLVRYGYKQVFEIHNQWWKKVVADSLEITTHWTKYGKGLEGKMRSKEYVRKEFPEIEDWPDLISHSKQGLIPRPEGSKAKAQQPDDRYDAIPIAVWMKTEVERGFDKSS
jgi:hypothetical protein